MAFMSEAALEQMLIDQLNALGYSIATEDVIGPDGSQPERESHDQTILTRRLTSAVARINPSVPTQARADAVRKLTQTEFPTLLEENRRIHKLLTEGVDVEYYAPDGTLMAGKVNLIDFKNVDNNDWLAVNQFVVIAGTCNRRPDVVVFVNGLPMAVIELKAPGNNNATVVSAFNQLQTYKT